MKKSFEDYMNQFIDGVSATVDVDYADRESIQRNNKGVDRYRKAARCMDMYYSEHMKDFARLLDSPLPCVSICCAVCLLELMHYNEEQEKRALKIICEAIENGDSCEKLGWRDWLERWETGNIKTVYCFE